MKWWLVILSIPVAVAVSACRAETDAARTDNEVLLFEWIDGLLSQQLRSDDPALDGGILCPACNRVHGRCPDAILPFMYAARKTGEQKYLDAAVKLWQWLEYNVSMPDGSWLNDVNVSDWKGTTVFAIIAIGEALECYGGLLPEPTRDAWWARLERAAQWVHDNDADFSRRHRGSFNQNVNYSASAPHALWMVGKKFGRQDFLDKAAEIAGDMVACFSPHDCLLFGEAPVMGPSPKGAWPVDLGYNVEESLPNLALYARAAGDSLLFDLTGRSMLSHLEFMLPDGAWDNSWGTRSFKWTYWGSRTSDGMMAGYCLYLKQYPQFRTAIARNIELLRRATRDGMLYGGMHYASAGVPPCNHHTFSHARGMASYLALDLPESGEAMPPLPRDGEYGVREIRDIRTWLISHGDWRATVTDFDAEYRVRGTHPKGGALSMLWHRSAGPLVAAGMNRYSLIEPTNMQTDRQQATCSPTPLIEYECEGRLYTSIDDPHAVVVCEKARDGTSTEFSISCSLSDIDGNTPPQGEVTVGIGYTFTADTVEITADLTGFPPPGEVRMVLPLIAENSSLCELTDGNTVSVTTATGRVYGCRTRGTGMSIGHVNENGRILGFTPGFEFIPVIIPLSLHEPLKITLFVNTP